MRVANSDFASRVGKRQAHAVQPPLEQQIRPSRCLIRGRRREQRNYGEGGLSVDSQ
jgi:hypothetical protein